MTAPAPGAALAGTVVLAAQASAPAGVAGVQFQLDGAPLGARVNAPPYALSWNTALAAGDTHLLTAVAWDVNGSSAVSAAVSVIVDNTPLVISGVSALGATAGAATIVWTTNQPTDTQVEYGPTEGYGTSTALDAAPTFAHAAPLSALAPGTPYHYRVKSKGAAGIPYASGDFAFATATAPVVDAVPPAVAVMNPAPGAFVSSTVMVSANATGRAGVAALQFMLDGTELGAPLTASPFLLAWNTALNPDGPHTLSAVARDAAGNAATAVVSVTVDNAPPVIGAPTIAAAAPNRADVLWTTDQRADSAADYGPTPAYGASTPVTAAQSTGHGVSLTGLAPGTLYHYCVKSRSAAGILSVSNDFTFTTPGAAIAVSSAAAAPAAADASAKAPQKFLTPASAGGANGKAVFGPQAREVWIFDARGRQVFHASSPGAGSPVVWDCRDATGRVVPSGVYVAKILTRDSTRLYQSFAVAK